jgi:Skp family chaperone for outer membrane proteins
MSKRDKTIAKIHSELKDKEASLKNKIKNAKDETEKSHLTDELYKVQYQLKRGAPNFGVK